MCPLLHLSHVLPPPSRLLNDPIYQRAKAIKMAMGLTEKLTPDQWNQHVEENVVRQSLMTKRNQKVSGQKAPGPSAPGRVSSVHASPNAPGDHKHDTARVASCATGGKGAGSGRSTSFDISGVVPWPGQAAQPLGAEDFKTLQKRKAIKYVMSNASLTFAEKNHIVQQIH